MEDLVKKLIEDKTFAQLMQAIKNSESSASCTGGGGGGGAGDCGSCQVS